VKRVICSAAAALLPLLAQAQPSPIKADRALLEAVRRGCLPLAQGQLTFVQQNAATLAEAGIVLPTRLPVFLGKFSKPPFQIMQLESQQPDIWLVGHATQPVCYVSTMGVSNAAIKNVAAFFDHDSTWQVVTNKTFIQDNLQSRTWTQPVKDGQLIEVNMVNHEPASPIPLEVRVLLITVQRIAKATQTD